MDNILNYYLMPHPPIIIPAVGKGEESKARMTINACLKVGAEIEALNPETIVIITPHGVMFRDCITISYESFITGDLSRFQARNVKVKKAIDLELSEEIINLAAINDIPTLKVNCDVLSKYHRQFELDHGALIPLTFIKGEYKIVHITYGLLENIDLFRFGTLIKQAINCLKRQTVIIASGDLSHRLSEDGPYPYSPNASLFDNTLLRFLREGDILGIFNMDKKAIEDAGECGLRSIYILLGCIRNGFKGELLSYEGPYGVGYGVMRFTIDNSCDNLKLIEEQGEVMDINKKDDYVILARKSIEYYLDNNRLMKVPDNIKQELLNLKAGVFVSLKKNQELRGCVGTFMPTKDNLALEIISNAISAAFRDPRFKALEKSELNEIDISVDVLTLPVIANKTELDPKTYGVIVSQAYKRGLLLPDLEGIDTVEEQLRIACLKAGINPHSDYQIKKFTVVRHHEVDHE